MTQPLRTHDDSGVDINDLAAVREAVRVAHEVGHWRRVLAIYGDHLPKCATRAEATTGNACDCGWVGAYGR